MRSSRAVLGLSALTLAGAVSTGAEGWDFAAWRTESAAVEAFLRDAEVIGSEPIPVGISRPTKLTLALGELEGAAIFKTIDVFETKMEFEDGSFAINFRDSYKNELAAYELDKLLGLGLVPPTVERRLDDVTGAVRLWIEGAMTEAERQAQGLGAPDPAAWSREVAAVRLFYNLTGNTDYRNIRNLLVDGSFRICAIDHSRAFQTSKRLVSERLLVRFSRDLLARLEALDDRVLAERLGAWVSRAQIKALLARRDRILARAEKMVALKGEAAVLYP